MRKFLLLFGLISAVLALFCETSRAGLSTYDPDGIELLTSFGPLQMWQSCDWFGADTAIASTNHPINLFEGYDTSTDWFANIDYSIIPWPYLLSWKHDKYFVKVYPEDPVTFSVYYIDTYGNLPSAGYPRLAYWLAGSSSINTLTLDLSGTQDSLSIYQKQIASLTPGTYYYKYSVKNSQFPEEFSLETSTFVTTRRPQTPGNSSTSTQSIVSNASVNLSWRSNDAAAGSFTYNLYAGTDPNNLALVYTGTDTNFPLKELAYGLQYYWSVEAVNQYGISSRSPLYSFSTISAVAKAFNYPNPFNPALGQSTNIVFDMQSGGSAELHIYTEFGDLCWSKSFDNLVKGANEISYDGKDDRGQMLYNGTYLCTIKKTYANGTDNEKCRLLVIK